MFSCEPLILWRFHWKPKTSYDNTKWYFKTSTIMDLTLKSGISTYQTFRTISRMENGGLKYPWKGVKCLCNEIFFSGHFFKTKYRCGEYLSRILRTTKQKQTTSDIWLASIFVFVSGGKKICSSSHETGLEFSFMSKSIWYYFYKVVISCERIYLTGESALFFPPGFSRTALSLGFTYPRISTFHPRWQSAGCHAKEVWLGNSACFLAQL